MPVEKSLGDAVIGGTLNATGSFQFRATRVGTETTLNQIITLVKEAQTSSTQIQRIADRVTAYFVPAVVIVAVARDPPVAQRQHSRHLLRSGKPVPDH